MGRKGADLRLGRHRPGPRVSGEGDGHVGEMLSRYSPSDFLSSQVSCVMEPLERFTPTREVVVAMNAGLLM